MTVISQIKTFLFYNILNSKLVKSKRLYRKADEDDKYQHILEAVNYLRVAQKPMVYFEFGCHSGRTFAAAMLAAKFLRHELDAYAFDSFEGLPDTKSEEDGIFVKGSFATSVEEFKAIILKKVGVEIGDSHLVKGFYSDTLNPITKKGLPQSVGAVHIDVDLYKSAIDVLNFVKDFLVNGTVVLFDDWYCFSPGENRGEQRALCEFCERNADIEFVHWKNYSTFGRSFIVELK